MGLFQSNFIYSILLLGILCFQSQAQTTINVGANETHKTIADAVAAASGGDIINIVDSVHTESGIAITKSLTITGQGAANTILQAAATTGSSTTRLFTISGGYTVNIYNLHLRYAGSSTTNGGAFSNNGSTVTVDSCEFSYCAGQRGGFIYTENSATTTITNSNFINTNMTTVYGGSVYCDNSTISISDCSFSDHYAYFGGTMYYVSTSTTLTNTIIDNGEAFFNGGGVYQDGGTLNLTSCTISNCIGQSGGGLLMNNSPYTINTTAFIGDSASSSGGAINITGTGTIYQCSFTSCGSAGTSAAINNTVGTATIGYSTFSYNRSTNSSACILNSNSGLRMLRTAPLRTIRLQQEAFCIIQQRQNS